MNPEKKYIQHLIKECSDYEEYIESIEAELEETKMEVIRLEERIREVELERTEIIRSAYHD